MNDYLKWHLHWSVAGGFYGTGFPDDAVRYIEPPIIICGEQFVDHLYDVSSVNYALRGSALGIPFATKSMRGIGYGNYGEALDLGEGRGVEAK